MKHLNDPFGRNMTLSRDNRIVKALEAFVGDAQEALQEPKVDKCPSEGIMETKGEEFWHELCERQGWDENSQIIHLEGFLRTHGLFSRFAEYARSVAEDENWDGTKEVPHVDY